MIPHEIERHQAQPQQVEIVLHLDPSLFWFSGHFAVQPLLPGVAQIDWVMHYAPLCSLPAGVFTAFRT
ncbi:ACP dehydratase [Citrobacter amalonaticus]|nr:ACP dehydratase [Citrobacter amalonaticus]